MRRVGEFLMTGNWAKSTVSMIVVLFLVSIILRLAGQPWAAAIAIAAEGEMEVAEEVASPEEMAGSQSDAEKSEFLAGVLAELTAREKKLNDLELQLKTREADLEAARIAIEQRLQALITAEERLRSTMALAASASEDDLARLTSVYENMKPAEAAALFSQMAPEFAAGFLGRMRPDAAAAIMAGLEANFAYSISVVLAGRNANVPSE